MSKYVPKKVTLPPPPGAEALPAGYLGRMSLVSDVREKLGRVVIKEPVKHYMGLGDDHLNCLFGDSVRGLYSGLMIELRGESSSAKTALAAHVAGVCAAQGAVVHWLDIEFSWHDQWMQARGLYKEGINLYQPYLGLDKIEDEEGKPKRLTKTQLLKLMSDPAKRKELEDNADIPSAEQMIDEIETSVKLGYKQYPGAFQLVVVDSLASLVTDEELGNDVDDQNMRTRLSLASLMSTVLKRWIVLMPSYNAAVIAINQLRVDPGKTFGDNRVSPGGKAVGFYPHVRITVARESGLVLKLGVPVGVKGVAHAFKQKAGGREGMKLNYRLPFDSTPCTFTEYTRVGK